MQQYRNNKPKFLDQLVKNSKLTPDGRDWLVLALDPFHDYEHPVSGYPDADGSQTIVSCYNYQADINKPAGVVGNWDCHVFNIPMCESSTHTLTGNPANWNDYLDTATTLNWGPLVIEAGPSGASIAPTAPLVANTQYTALPPLGNASMISGITRVIGMGYEVTNTTSALNKQGAVTVYRMPQYVDGTSNVALRNAAGTQISSVPVRRYRMPPTSIAQVNLLKGTRTWDAAEGVYANCVLNSAHNPMMLGDNSIMLGSASGYPGVAEVNPRSEVSVMAANASPVPSIKVPLPTQMTPYDTTGSYFTGLSEETTLTVKYRVYVERAPSWTDIDLAVLTTPSAGLDELALRLYSHAISQLPVAVTVKENGIGDWFKGVVSVLRDVAGTTGAFLNPVFPGAGAVGSAVSTILRTIAPNTAPTKMPRLISGMGKTVRKVTNDKNARTIAKMAGRIKSRKSFAAT